MKRVLLATLCLGLLAPVALAKGGAGGYGGFTTSIGFVDFSGLNSTLGRYRFDELGSLQWLNGGAGFGWIDRVMIGGSGWAGTQTVASESLGLRCRVTVSGGQFDLGYTVIDFRRLSVTPMLGIGASGCEIALEPANASLPNLDSLLLHPGRTSAVSYTEFAGSLQLALTIPISFVALQLRGGYAFTPGTPAWELADGGKLLRGPAVAKGMPFVHLCVLFGGRSRGGE
jgi:hypothetical protein